MHPSLFEQIGEPFIQQAIKAFYDRAFADPIIGHFFFGKDHNDLTKKQVDFTIALLGGENRYQGKNLAAAHKDLILREPHFNRRQILMKEVLAELQLDPILAKSWLKLEERLQDQIIKRIK